MSSSHKRVPVSLMNHFLCVPVQDGSHRGSDQPPPDEITIPSYPTLSWVEPQIARLQWSRVRFGRRQAQNSLTRADSPLGSPMVSTGPCSSPPSAKGPSQGWAGTKDTGWLAGSASTGFVTGAGEFWGCSLRAGDSIVAHAWLRVRLVAIGQSHLTAPFAAPAQHPTMTYCTAGTAARAQYTFKSPLLPPSLPRSQYDGIPPFTTRS